MSKITQQINGSLKPALVGALITTVLGIAAWGAADRLEYETRIVRLESAANSAAVERDRILQSVNRLENKIDELSRDIRSSQ